MSQVASNIPAYTKIYTNKKLKDFKISADFKKDNPTITNATIIQNAQQFTGSQFWS